MSYLLRNLIWNIYFLRNWQVVVPLNIYKTVPVCGFIVIHKTIAADVCGPRNRILGGPSNLIPSRPQIVLIATPLTLA